jgi:serpin B
MTDRLHFFILVLEVSMQYAVFFLISFLLPTFAFSQTSKVSQASNQLAFELYKLNSNNPGNLFFSSFSIEAALAMTAAGAQKETLRQMLKTLHLGPNYHAEFRELLAGMKGSEDFQMFIANRIWGGLGTEYSPSFLKVLRDNYGADLVALDFKKQPEPSRLKINQWVQQQTKDKIKDLLQAGTVTPATDLILTNAVYFKGVWTEPFKKDLTKPELFQISTTEKKSIPFMHTKEHFRYGESADLQLLEMSYKGSELVMDILLPKLGINLSQFEKKIDSAAVEELIGKSFREEVEVSMPKFKTESQLSLRENLVSLGMPLAFDRGKADFHGIRNIPPGENLFISAVIHKAFVDVNEEGTEAAAATAVTMDEAAWVPKPPQVFKADRPFVFLIRHVKSGAILFLGRYSKP